MKKFAFFAVVGLIATFSSQARAALMLSVDDGVNPAIVVTDEDANDTGIGAGTIDLILFSGSVGIWDVVVEVGISDGVLGINRMDLNNTAVSNVGAAGPAGTLTLMLTDENFSGPGYVLEIGGTTNGSVTASVYTGANNTPFDLGTLVTSSPALGAGAFSNTSSGSAGAAPHQITLVAVVSHPAGTGLITTFDAEVSPVPEPASLTLLGMGALGLVGYARRRKAAA